MQRRTSELLKYKSPKYEMTVLEKAIAKLPEVQQDFVRICFKAVKVSPKQIRYSTDFIYESLLMKIKSRRLYNHMRKRKILHLPSLTTLNTYISKLQPKYGFQQAVFDDLLLKAGRMNIQDKQGTV